MVSWALSGSANKWLLVVEKTFYETMSKNTGFSSLNRSASALEQWSKDTEILAIDMIDQGDGVGVIKLLDTRAQTIAHTGYRFNLPGMGPHFPA